MINLWNRVLHLSYNESALAKDGVKNLAQFLCLPSLLFAFIFGHRYNHHEESHQDIIHACKNNVCYYKSDRYSTSCCHNLLVAWILNASDAESLLQSQQDYSPTPDGQLAAPGDSHAALNTVSGCP